MASISTLAPSDRLPRLFVGRTTALGLALIPKLFALGQRKFNLDLAVFEVHPRRDQSESLLLRLADQLADFLPMHKQLPRPQRRMIRVAPVFIRTDMAVQQPQLPVLDEPVRVLQVRPATPDRLHLGPRQRHPSLKFFQQEVVMRSDPINGSIPLSARGGIPPRGFLRIRLGLMRGLTGH